MDLLVTVSEVIDTRSFSAVWYWIAVATIWSSATHWILGIPWDMVVRARADPAAAEDLQDLARVNVNRALRVVQASGTAATALVAAALTLMGVTGFVYGAEFAQALFLIAAPMTLASLLAARRARIIARESASGDALIAHLVGLRRQVQAIALVAIFVSALYGMLWNLAVGPFG